MPSDGNNSLTVVPKRDVAEAEFSCFWFHLVDGAVHRTLLASIVRALIVHTVENYPGNHRILFQLSIIELRSVNFLYDTTSLGRSFDELGQERKLRIDGSQAPNVMSASALRGMQNI